MWNKNQSADVIYRVDYRVPIIQREICLELIKGIFTANVHNVQNIAHSIHSKYNNIHI